jgi:FAD/FMN-containing dehydrogenase
MKKLFFFLSVSLQLFADWPTEDQWKELSRAVRGRLIHEENPFTSRPIEEVLKIWQNPYLIQQQPWGTELVGWLGSWTTAASPYVVAAQNTEDIVAAVNFARKHQLKLVIKGCAHDYLGRSCAPNSLLIWTFNMQKVTVHDAFIPAGAPPKTKGVKAMTAQAGARWIDAYTEVTTKRHRYVQGGGCTTVGVAGGFLQGGGFGSFSKKYGTGAGSLLEAEVVLANGQVVIANDYQNSDLFWALKGGGGGTFGVVTRVTLQTHELPKYFGGIYGQITAKNDASFKKLIEQFLQFYHEHLNNEHWGEQVKILPENVLQLDMCFQGLNEKQVSKIWKPWIDWVKSQSDVYTMRTEIDVVPADKWWDREFRVKTGIGDNMTPYKDHLFYWKGNQGEVGAFIYAHRTRWIPLSLFKKREFAQVLFDASRHLPIALHFNKGLSGAPQETIAREKKTCLNPIVLESAALAILASIDQGIYPGVPGHELDQKKGQEFAAKVNAAAEILFNAIPHSGSYSNETDYFEKDWSFSFWGENYPKLLQIKQKYDPDNLFRVHHGVGN